VSAAAAAPLRNLVRVTGERNGIIEFEYGVGDLSLAIELMLPPAAFEDFCRTNAVEIVTEARVEVASEEERAIGWLPSDVQRRI
jgi:phenol hydroxylase P0 protein